MSASNKIPHSKCTIESEDIDALISLAKTGLLTSGPMSQLFEIELGKMLSQKHVRLSTSGTMAFLRILIALGVSKDDEILVPDYICKSLLSPIKVLNAKAVVYDNSVNSWLSDAQSIAGKINAKTKAVIVNHTYGFPFPDIKLLNERFGSRINIIEDCCHALTVQSKIGSMEISSNTLCSFYSFNATKLIATGEGGAISTNDDSFAQELDKTFIGDYLSDISCSLGISQLRKLSSFLERRLEIAEIYNRNFGEFRPAFFKNYPGVYFRYTIIVENASVFIAHPSVTYRKGVDSLLTSHLGQSPSTEASKMLNKTISIPIYPTLTRNDINNVVEATKRILIQ